MEETKPAPSIIEGTVKFRDGKKWKSRWCVMRKLSPVADCVHLQLYKDNKDRQKNGQTKASLSLQHFLGFESGFTLDKESNTLAILCEDVIPVLAFDTREILIQWRVKVQHNLGTSREFPATVISSPAGSGVRVGPVRLHARAARLAACAARPPTLLALWDVKLLRRYGVVEGRLCVEGGSRCGRGAGLFVFAAERARELVELLSAPAPGDVGSRMSIASRNGSVLEKRFSDTSSCIEESCCHTSMRSVSPAWNVPASHTHACISDLDTSLDGDHPRRPNSLPRCSSCLGKFGGPLTRSSTLATTPGGVSLLNPAWIMDNITEKRSDSDRASIYSRSSGSASEYSVPRGGCILDKSFDSKRSSPVGCCTPTVPVKMGTGCQCWQLQQKCCCPKKKLFSGPYENYDVPKTPMPLIQEHPVDISNGSDPSSYYDTPKKFIKCLVESGELCRCSPKVDNSPAIEDSNQNINENNNTEQPIMVQAEVHSNYVNINPVVIDKPEVNKLDLGNYSNIDLSTTLEKFESSLQILRSAGFSQEEIDALEDIPEHEDDVSAASSNTVHPSTECCNQHLNYMHMEPLDTSSISNSNKACSDNISRISHLSDPLMQHSDFDSTVGQPRPSSADFIKRAEDSDLYTGDGHREMSFKINGLRKSGKSECISDNCQICPRTRLAFEGKDKFKVPEVTKSEISFVARFRESVKIRRSSSVPSKSDKNRDSSSSNDSGVSTGSLKHHRCDFSEFELPITSSKSCKKHMKCTKYRKSVAPSHLSMFVKSSSSDPLKNITFQFEEVATMTKSNSCDVDTLTRRSKPKGDTSIDSANRISQMTTQSTSSGASDMSDYMESLSVSSFSSYDVSDNSRHLTRPRSGKEYLSIDRALLVGACNIDPQV